MESFKSKSIDGVLWSSIEKFLSQGVQFFVNIVMARLLLPSDYGIIAILMVLLSVMQLFIDGGFTTALIQRKDRDEKDFSTVFTFNMLISIAIYIILFISAKYITTFYEWENLDLYLKIISINLIISSFSAVQKTKLIIAVDFKTLSIISVISVCISGCVGIYMAYNGKGVWALIMQSICNTTFNVILLSCFSRWHPHYFFVKDSFKKLFAFSSKLFLLRLIDQIYMNLYPLVIGKFFSSSQLGIYTRAQQFATLPASSFSDILLRVTLPIISSINDDDVLIKVYKKYIMISSYLIFPVMISVIVLAYPIVQLLLTDKWIPIVVFLQILCLGVMFDHIGTINRNLLYAKGRSDLALKMEGVKKIIAVLILTVSVPKGIWGICIGQAFYGICSVYLNSYYTKGLIGISFITQIRYVISSFLLSVIMGVVMYFVACSYIIPSVKIIIGLLVGVFCYLSLSVITKNNAFKELILISKYKLKH